jgi:hypothetical protein
MEINDLPDELLLYIFSSLQLGSLTDVFNLALTCKNWRRILWSKGFLERIYSFEYQSRFLIYRCLPSDHSQYDSFGQFLDYDPYSSTSYLTINGDLSSFKQNIQNCSLIDTSISMWCRTIDHLSVRESAIFLLWHFHLGYIGFYRNSPDRGNALIKCTYTKQHELKTAFHMEFNQWYHIAIVINAQKGFQLYINGDRIGNWPLEEKINREDVSIAPHSTIWLASHCGVFKWHGSLFDICLWKRCLESYEIKEMARTRTAIENTDFTSSLSL